MTAGTGVNTTASVPVYSAQLSEDHVRLERARCAEKTLLWPAQALVPHLALPLVLCPPLDLCQDIPSCAVLPHLSKRASSF